MILTVGTLSCSKASWVQTRRQRVHFGICHCLNKSRQKASETPRIKKGSLIPVVAIKDAMKKISQSENYRVLEKTGAAKSVASQLVSEVTVLDSGSSTP